jgi:hypothetical protein
MRANGYHKTGRVPRKGETASPRSTPRSTMPTGEMLPSAGTHHGEMPKGPMTSARATGAGEMPKGEMIRSGQERNMPKGEMASGARPPKG